MIPLMQSIKVIGHINQKMFLFVWNSISDWLRFGGKEVQNLIGLVNSNNIWDCDSKCGHNIDLKIPEYIIAKFIKSKVVNQDC